MSFCQFIKYQLLFPQGTLGCACVRECELASERKHLSISIEYCNFDNHTNSLNCLILYCVWCEGACLRTCVTPKAISIFHILSRAPTFTFGSQYCRQSTVCRKFVIKHMYVLILFFLSIDPISKPVYVCSNKLIFCISFFFFLLFLFFCSTFLILFRSIYSFICCPSE